MAVAPQPVSPSPQADPAAEPSVHVSTYGDGPRVLVGMHGWGSEHRKSYRDVLEHLPDDVTFHGVDLPGCGRSAPPPTWSWDAITDQLAARLDTLSPGQPITLVGACSGSYHALATAMRRPERLQALVLLEPFAYMPWFFRIFTLPVTGSLLYRMVFDNPIGRAATERSLRRQGVSSDFDMVDAFGKNDLATSYHYLKFYAQIPDHRVFAPIHTPVRVVTGQSSWRAIHDAVPMWRELWPDLEAIELAGVGHMFNQEAPERAAAAIFEPFALPADPNPRPYGHPLPL